MTTWADFNRRGLAVARAARAGDAAEIRRVLDDGWTNVVFSEYHQYLSTLQLDDPVTLAVDAHFGDKYLTPLEEAARAGHTDAVKLLLEHFTLKCNRSERVRHCLQYALLECLLAAGDETDKGAAANAAVVERFYEIARLLILHGVAPVTKDARELIELSGNEELKAMVTTSG